MTLRFDNGLIQTLLKPHVAHQGHLRLDGIATRSGVFDYKDPKTGKIIKELRHPDEVLDPRSLETLAGVPITIQHPPERVTTKNFSRYGVGTVGDEVDATSNPYVRVKLNLQKSDAIAAVSQGTRELSCGYDCDVIEEPGVWRDSSTGQIIPYDTRQTNIRYNHLAIVDLARAGRNARVRFDSEEEFLEQQEIIQISQLIDISPEPINRENLFNLVDLATLLFA